MLGANSEGASCAQGNGCGILPTLSGVAGAWLPHLCGPVVREPAEAGVVSVQVRVGTGPPHSEALFPCGLAPALPQPWPETFTLPSHLV